MNDLSNYFNWKSPHLHIKISGENCINDMFPEFEIGKTKIIADNTYMDSRVQIFKIILGSIIGLKRNV